MDADHKSRSLVPVALATGGYVDLMNAGWDHQRPKDCGGYDCLKRLMTFHTTIAVNRSYDLAFTALNPRSIRLMLPSGAGEETVEEQKKSRVQIAGFTTKQIGLCLADTFNKNNTKISDRSDKFVDRSLKCFNELF